jgi:hypothetical protein
MLVSLRTDETVNRLWALVNAYFVCPRASAGERHVPPKWHGAFSGHLGQAQSRPSGTGRSFFLF